MTATRYLVRFDDICPTMNWAMWNEIEAILIASSVSPILAVVPDNRDPKLMVDSPRPDFWDRVKGWQARGWTIGLHGYQHRYVNQEGGLLSLNRQSEFAGLSYEEQSLKLRSALEIFEREGVSADCWVAPAHSFDWSTVRALAELGVHVISDGFAFSPYQGLHGSVWIPQQFARMRPMPFGVWTFCYHHNGMTEGGLATFRHDLKHLASSMIDLPGAVALAKSPRTAADEMVTLLRRAVSGVRRRPSNGLQGGEL